MNLKTIEEFYNQWTKIGYPKEFNYEKNSEGKSTHQDMCEVKNCENNPTIQLYDSMSITSTDEFIPLELICKKHYNSNEHLNFAFKKIKDENGEVRPKYTKLK